MEQRQFQRVLELNSKNIWRKLSNSWRWCRISIHS